jgi:hypothetical protein
MKHAVSMPKKLMWLALLLCCTSEMSLTQSDLRDREAPRTSAAQTELGPSPVNAIAAPTLKWAYGGCFSSWCQTGWYSSPAVADINGDGKQEVLWGSYDLAAVSGNDGKLVWSGRAWLSLI